MPELYLRGAGCGTGMGLGPARDRLVREPPRTPPLLTVQGMPLYPLRRSGSSVGIIKREKAIMSNVVVRGWRRGVLMCAFPAALLCAAAAAAADFNARGNIVIADQFNNRVIEIDPHT